MNRHFLFVCQNILIWIILSHLLKWHEQETLVLTLIMLAIVKCEMVIDIKQDMAIYIHIKKIITHYEKDNLNCIKFHGVHSPQSV